MGFSCTFTGKNTASATILGNKNRSIPMNYWWILILVTLLAACRPNRKETAISKMQVACSAHRFDEAFARALPTDLPQLKKTYPYLFSNRYSDSVWVDYMNNPFQKEISQEVQQMFPDFKEEQAALCSLFQHIVYYFPHFEPPKIVTITAELDATMNMVYADSLLLISLDAYLGKDHRFYREIPRYLKKNYTRGQIVVDAAEEIAKSRVPYPEERTFLSQLIYQGKILYLKQLWLPGVPDAQKMGYTETEYTWVKANEGYIWRYFVERDMLFSADGTLKERFIEPAPFSKFYLEIDSESPGMTGRYIGWQIVQAYMKNNDVSLQKMLMGAAEDIFRSAAYKPEK